MRFEGRVRRLGDNVNTDYIISSARKRETIDAHVLKRYLLEAIDPSFAASVLPGDILAGGRNFGCGSAMEVAATVIVAAGVRVVLASSFSRSFFRNAINNGLAAIECDTTPLVEGDRVTVQVDDARSEVVRPADGLRLPAASLAGITAAILGAGGLVPYLRAQRGFRDLG